MELTWTRGTVHTARMLNLVDRIVRCVVRALLVLLAILIVAATVDLGWTLAVDLLSPPVGRLNLQETLGTLGMFLTVLIAIEMMHVVRLYLEDRHLDVEIVLMVALIAIARKVIVFDLEKFEAPHMFGIAAIILALACALFLLHITGRSSGTASLIRPKDSKTPEAGASR